VPLAATATNVSDPAGPPHVTDVQSLSAALDRIVHLTPSGLVITLLPVPLAATATNVSDPAGPPHVTDVQSLSAALDRIVHVTPDGGGDDTG